MAGPAVEPHLGARGAGDRRDDTDGRVALLQHRPLLDVQLDVSEQLLAAARGGAGSVAERGKRVAHGDAVRVGERERRRVERPRDRAAAEVRGAEPQPLLVAEAEHVDGERQADLLRAQPRDALDRRDHAERAVERAGVADRVEVRAEQQRARVRVAAGHAADEVPRGVDPHGHPGLRHPAADQRVRARHRRAREPARQSPFLLADPRELAAAFDDAH